MTGTRVLVIDDNAINREILIEQCAAGSFDCARRRERRRWRLPFSTTPARLGAPVDSSSLDFQMPDMSGADVCRAILRRAPGDETGLSC